MSAYPISGGCSCRQLRYTLLKPPICLHACYCHHCHRESGSTHALNATTETSSLQIHLPPAKSIKWTLIPSTSGSGHRLGRCPDCLVAVFSIYGSDAADGERRTGAGMEVEELVLPPMLIVRAGTLDEVCLVGAPTAHIYTGGKVPWLLVGEGVPVFEGGYDPRGVWGEESVRRWESVTGRELVWW